MNVVVRDPRWGFWKCDDRLRHDGAVWNRKRVHRVYCALRLNLAAPDQTPGALCRVRQPLLRLPFSIRSGRSTSWLMRSTTADAFAP